MTPRGTPLGWPLRRPLARRIAPTGSQPLHRLRAGLRYAAASRRSRRDGRAAAEISHAETVRRALWSVRLLHRVAATWGSFTSVSQVLNRTGASTGDGALTCSNTRSWPSGRTTRNNSARAASGSTEQGQIAAPGHQTPRAPSRDVTLRPKLSGPALGCASRCRRTRRTSDAE